MKDWKLWLTSLSKRIPPISWIGFGLDYSTEIQRLQHLAEPYEKGCLHLLTWDQEITISLAEKLMSGPSLVSSR